MKEEIKEILDEMRFMQEKKVKFYSLDIYQSKILLDYITNLQEEIELTKNCYMSLTKICEKRLERYLDYKSRIDKAIPIIDKLLENSADNQLVAELEEMEYFIWIDSQYEKLINILQGE